LPDRHGSLRRRTEAVQRPTMKFVATRTAEQLDLQALHRVRERLVSQRTGIVIRSPYRRVAWTRRAPRRQSPWLFAGFAPRSS
jgi:transposase